MIFPNNIEYNPKVVSGKSVNKEIMPPVKPPAKLEKSSVLKVLTEDRLNAIINKVKREGIMKRAVNFGVIGSGQCGGRLAEEFEKLGYPAIVINTSEQDLADNPCKHKLCIGVGGAGRDLKVGASAVNRNRDKIMAKYREVFPSVTHALVCAGSSGGSGGGGLANIIDTLSDFKIPVGVLTTIPLLTEDTRSKKNTLIVLNDLVKLSQQKKISPLILMDNDKIEKKYPGLSTLEFWHKANEDVVKCFDLFNILSAKNSAYTSLDPADYKKILFAGGCLIFGNIAIDEDIKIDTLSKKITENINGGLLAEGFNLVEATTAGCIIVSNSEKLKNIPRIAEENAFATLLGLLGSGTIFKGVYSLDQVINTEVFFMIAGLGLPESRIRDLLDATKKEIVHLEKKAPLRTVDDIIRDLEGDTEQE